MPAGGQDRHRLRDRDRVVRRRVEHDDFAARLRVDERGRQRAARRRGGAAAAVAADARNERAWSEGIEDRSRRGAHAAGANAVGRLDVARVRRAVDEPGDEDRARGPDCSDGAGIAGDRVADDRRAARVDWRREADLDAALHLNRGDAGGRAGWRGKNIERRAEPTRQRIAARAVRADQRADLRGVDRRPGRRARLGGGRDRARRDAADRSRADEAEADAGSRDRPAPACRRHRGSARRR